MSQLKMSVMMVALILVINYNQFRTDAFDHLPFHNDKNFHKALKHISNSKEETPTPIYPNGRHKRYDTVQNIGKYINDEREKYVTKSSTATESILALTQSFNYQNRKKKSEFESYSPSHEHLSTNRQYLPPSHKYIPTRVYLPPSHKYLPVQEASTEKVLIVEESGNSTEQTPTETISNSSAQMQTVLVIDKDANATSETNFNNSLTVPEIISNSTAQTQTVVDVTGNTNSTTTTSDNAKESVDYHKEDHHKNYDHVVHHYHHILYHHHHVPHIAYHYYDLPHIDYHHHGVPHDDYHHEHIYHICGEHNPTSSMMKPCKYNGEHDQHVRKHKSYNHPSFSDYPHYPSYSHFPAYPHYSPISISYVPNLDDSLILSK